MDSNANARGGTSSSEDSLGDPKGVVDRSFTERDLIDERHLAPPRPRGAAAFSLEGDSWARRSDPWDLDRDSRIL